MNGVGWFVVDVTRAVVKFSAMELGAGDDEAERAIRGAG